MTSPSDLIIFDLDETLLDLHLDVEELRAVIRPMLGEHLVDPKLQPLYQCIAQSTAKLREHDPLRAQALQTQVWSYISDYELRCAQERAVARPLAIDLIDKLKHQHLAVYSNNQQAAVEQALLTTGFPLDAFTRVVGRQTHESLKPSGQPVLDIIARIGLKNINRIFFVGDSHYDALCVKNAQAALGDATRVHFVALHPSYERLEHLEDLGASFVARDYEELAPLLLTPRLSTSVSVSCLGFNEAPSISSLIHDARALRETHLPNLELLYIDDGSTDTTPEVLESHTAPWLRVFTHPHNLGMGSSMRTGYLESHGEYLAHLPADRQVRLQHLLPFLAPLSQDCVVVSRYQTAPSGEARRLMSRLFRLCVVYLGGLRQDFAGTYLFHRKWLPPTDGAWARCKTFVLSFVLLQNFREHGATLARIVIRPFPRRHGISKEAKTHTIGRVLRELLKVRIWRSFGRK